jgi:hypothetical protein
VRTYSVAVAALAIASPAKWLDNLLSQNTIDEIEAGERGRSRRIGFPALLRIATIRILHSDLGMSVTQAVSVSSVLIRDGRFAAGPLTLALDLEELRRGLERSLIIALESAPQPRRGRPARRV